LQSNQRKKNNRKMENRVNNGISMA